MSGMPTSSAMRGCALRAQRMLCDRLPAIEAVATATQLRLLGRHEISNYG
jgi:hypothetical protein